MKTYFLVIKLVFFGFCLLPFLGLAQGSDPVPATPASLPVGAPIDGGVVALLMAGLTYGFYKNCIFLYIQLKSCISLYFVICNLQIWASCKVLFFMLHIRLFLYKENIKSMF